MDNTYEVSQQIWQSINALAAVCATPGINEKVQEKANQQILKLLESLEPVFTKVGAKAQGLIV